MKTFDEIMAMPLENREAMPKRPYLTDDEKAVLATIAQSTKHGGGWHEITLREIADNVSCSTRERSPQWVMSAVKRFFKQGYITQIHRGGGIFSNLYKLHEMFE